MHDCTSEMVSLIFPYGSNVQSDAPQRARSLTGKNLGHLGEAAPPPQVVAVLRQVQTDTSWTVPTSTRTVEPEQS